MWLFVDILKYFCRISCIFHAETWYFTCKNVRGNFCTHLPYWSFSVSRWKGHIIPCALYLVTVREVKLGIGHEIRKWANKPCHKINQDFFSCQSHELHTDSSQTGPDLSKHFFIGNHSHGSDCYALSWSISMESSYNASRSLFSASF